MVTSDTTDITVILPAGRASLPVLDKLTEIARRLHLEVYCTTLQNIRLLAVPSAEADAVKGEFAALGASCKKPGTFPVPRICVGKPHCKLGLVDTRAVSEQILGHFSARAVVKPKLKIAIAGCMASCSGAKLSDFGIIAGRQGYDLYVGGKGGPNPRVARRVLRGAAIAEVLSAMENLLDFHDHKTKAKQRLHKLLSDPEFPLPEV